MQRPLRRYWKISSKFAGKLLSTKKGGTMGVTVFIYIVAVFAFCFGLINFIQFLRKRNRTARTIGTILSIKTSNPENTKFRNSKWAILSYKANGKTYLSQKRIQVPMVSQVGTKISVRYDIHHPEKLYRFSASRIIVPILIAVFCIALAKFGFI